jgi:hypothetical protein
MVRRIAVGGLMIGALSACYFFGRAYWYPLYLALVGKKTVVETIDRHGLDAEERLQHHFSRAAVAYPPQQILLFAIKEKKQLELWARTEQRWQLITRYEVKAASGQLGPKLREGDRQVPEGIYHIEYLNPNSAYHLSMKLDYPNAFDREKARSEGRTQPGSDIFIHGKAVSIGCLAIGDPAIEELFTLVHQIGKDKVKVVIAPTDPRDGRLVPPAHTPPWVGELYQHIEQALADILET